MGFLGSQFWKNRLGLFGDLPSRLLRGVIPYVPPFLEPVLIAGWTLLFFAIAREQRRAVRSNLQALHPHWSDLRSTWGAWRVFWNFAFTFVDSQRCETETGGVDWLVDGIGIFHELAERSDGCIILTAHMGNYDIAAPMFSSRFGRALYAVRAPERSPAMQAMREKEMRRKEALHPNFRTLYNEGGNLLGIELARLLQEGNLVAVQGDRVIFDVAPMDVEVEPGLWMRLPKGPLFLARATGADCYPLFIRRDGWRRYHVRLFPPLKLPVRQRGQEDEAPVIWARAILRCVRENWAQWYVFEPLVGRRPFEEKSA